MLRNVTEGANIVTCKHNNHITTRNNKQSWNNIILQTVSEMLDLIYYWSMYHNNNTKPINRSSRLRKSSSF